MEERIRKLITRIDSGLDHVTWVGPASAEAISRVEAEMGVRFPASFRSFLALTGGGGVRGFRISSVLSAHPLSDQSGTVCGDTRHYHQLWVPRPLPAHLVVIQRSADDHDPFCLDTSRWAGDECPVVLYSLHTGRVERIAPDFLAFYDRYLEPRFQALTE